MYKSLVEINFFECDALIIFFHEWDWAVKAGKSFKINYPNGNLIYSRDTRPFTNRDKFNSVEPILITKTYSTTQFFLDIQADELRLEDTPPQQILNKIFRDLDRMAEALSMCKNDYLIYMEADSYVNSRIPIPIYGDMDSLEANKYPKKILDFVDSIGSKDFPLTGWGFVTAPIKVKAGFRLIEWAHQNKKVIFEMIKIDPFIAYLDYFAPIFMHLSGGQVYNSGAVGECKRDKKWKRKNYALLHQYRF